MNSILVYWITKIGGIVTPSPNTLCRMYIEQIYAWKKFAIEKTLAVFDNAEEEAESLIAKEFERLGSMPGEGDMGSLAETARDAGITYYITMKSVEQSLKNLLAAGIYHLFEQQCKQFGFPISDIKKCQEYEKIREAALVANTVKHGEGDAANGLRKARPDLFDYSPLNGFSLGGGVGDEVRQPLAGESIYVSREDIEEYANAMCESWMFTQTVLDRDIQ